MTSKTITQNRRAVIVTTEHRGVFFGYGDDTSGTVVTLNQVRMCVYWSSAMKGILGLASDGPDAQCRVSEPISQMEIRAVTAVMDVSPDAAAAWESSPWG